MKSELKNRILVALIATTLTIPMFLSVSYAQEIRHPVIFVYSMEANFQPEGHFNPYSETGYGGHFGVNLFDQLAPHVLGTSNYYPELATNWTYNGDWLVVKLRTGVTWHDGQAFTSKDVWGVFMLHKIRGYAEWSSNMIDDIQIVDNNTIKFHVIGLKDLAMNVILSAYMDASYHIYKTYIDALAAHPENIDQISVDLVQFNPRTPAQVVGTGPFMFVNMTESDLWLKKFPNFYAADKIVIDYVHGIKEPSNEVGWGYFFSNTGDWGEPFAPVPVADSLTSSGVKVMYAKSVRHDMIVFNHRRPLLANKLFRQAVAYSLNRTELVLSANYPVFHAAKYVIPYSAIYVNNWLDSSFLDGLNSYGYNPDKARTLFSQIGLKYNDKDQLCYANGSVITLYLKFPAPWTDVALMMANLATQLNRVGITVIPLALDWATVDTAEWAGDFDLVWYNFGFDHPFTQGFEFTSGYTISTWAGLPTVIDWQGSQLDLTQFFIDWGKAKSVAEEKPFVEKLAKIYNDYLFTIPFADVDAQFYGSGRFIYPPTYDNSWMCTDYARGFVIGQIIFPGKFALNMTYWAVAPKPAAQTPIETYIIAGLAVVVVILLAALFFMRRK